MNNNRKNSRNHKKGMKTWQKRLIDGLVHINGVQMSSSAPWRYSFHPVQCLREGGLVYE